MAAQTDLDKISVMLGEEDGLGGLSAWGCVVRHEGKAFVAVDNTKGTNDAGIVTLRKLIVKVCRWLCVCVCVETS